MDKSRNQSPKTTVDQENHATRVYKENHRMSKPSRYVSKYHDAIKAEMRRTKSSHRTMGVAKYASGEPLKLTCQHIKVQHLTDRHTPKSRRQEHLKPPIPKIEDKPLMGLKSDKNFVTENAIRNIHSTPFRPVPKVVDNRWGTAYLYEGSGLIPTFIFREDYGRVPSYLVKRKEVQRKYENVRKEYLMQRQRHSYDSMEKLSGAEIDSMLQELKKRWKSLNTQFLSLPVQVDTVSKKQWKERLESELKKVETYINMLERNSVIFISNH